MSKLGDALRRKYKNPQEAIAALGLDAALLAADSKPKENDMTGKVLSRVAIAVQSAALAKYALDSKSVAPIVAGLTFKNFKTQRPIVAAALKGMAKDASLEDVTQMLDKLEKVEGMDDEPEEMAAIDWEKAAADACATLGRDETPEEEETREKKMAAEDARRRMGRDETPEEMKKREAEDKKARDARRGARDAKKARDAAAGAEEPKVTKGAMDAALKAAELATDSKVAAAVANVRAQMRAVDEAKAFAEPYVGRFARSMAFDTAEDVFKAALEMRGVKLDGVHPSAFRHILQAQPMPGAVEGAVEGGRTLAMDEADATDFGKLFPSAAAIHLHS